jgi:hypothetical protein
VFVVVVVVVTISAVYTVDHHTINNTACSRCCRFVGTFGQFLLLPIKQFALCCHQSVSQQVSVEE